MVIKLTMFWKRYKHKKCFHTFFLDLSVSSYSRSCASCILWYICTKSSIRVSLLLWNLIVLRSHWLFSIIPCVRLSCVKFWKNNYLRQHIKAQIRLFINVLLKLIIKVLPVYWTDWLLYKSCWNAGTLNLYHDGQYRLKYYVMIR